MTGSTKRAAKPRTERSKTQAKDIAYDEVMTMIAEAAYYRAQGRGFSPGHEENDWLAAEKDIRSSLPG